MFITEQELHSAIFSPMKKGNKLTDLTNLTHRVRGRVETRNIIGGPQLQFQTLYSDIMNMVSVIRSTHSEEERVETLARCTREINRCHDILELTLSL